MSRHRSIHEHAGFVKKKRNFLPRHPKLPSSPSFSFFCIIPDPRLGVCLCCSIYHTPTEILLPLGAAARFDETNLCCIYRLYSVPNTICFAFVWGSLKTNHAAQSRNIAQGQAWQKRAGRWYGQGLAKRSSEAVQAQI